MSRWHLADIAALVHGTVKGENVPIDAVSIDTRTMTAGSLYIAIKGERYDGHQFIQSAKEGGAAAALVSAEDELCIPHVLVADTMQALIQFAQQWRQQLTAKLIALTGSNGKTTTKTMITKIMELCGSTGATKGNFNNHIGVPLTLLDLHKDTQYAVVEMGANHQGEIRNLCSIAQPDIGMVLNAGDAHIEGFGDLDGVAQAKGEIYESLSKQSTAVFNCDDKYYDYWKQRFQGDQSLGFGLAQNADVSIETSAQGARKLRVFNEQRDLHLKLAGQHNAMNAVAAAAAATAAGADIDRIVAGLEKTTSVPGRMTDVRGLNAMSVIDDTYNANPDSLYAALNVLQERPERRWLALGNMEELGERSEQAHISVATQAKAAGVEWLFSVGDLAGLAAQAFGKQGMHFDSMDELIAHLKTQAASDVCLLVKGSRSARMERLVDALTEREERC